MKWDDVTLNEAKSLNLKLGDVVVVNGILVKGDSYETHYSVVADHTGVNDGVTFIDTYNNLQLEIKMV